MTDHLDELTGEEAEQIAHQFHEVYERLAPGYGWVDYERNLTGVVAHAPYRQTAP